MSDKDDQHKDKVQLDPVEEMGATVFSAPRVDSDRERARRVLQQMEALYRSLFDLSFQGIVIFTPSGQIVDTNSGLCETLGFTKDELEGRNLRALQADPVAWESFLETLKSKSSVEGAEWKTRAKDGTHRDLLVSCFALSREDGKVYGYQALVRDVSEQKKSEELAVQTDRMNAMGEMAGAVAHNLRNLLQIIVGNTRLALSNLESGNLREVKFNLQQVLGRLRSAGETARLLDHFAGVRKTRFPRGNRTLDLSRIAEKAMQIAQAWLEADTARQDIKIGLQSQLMPGCLVAGVESELLEVVVNLLWNAVEAFPEGGHVTLTTWRQDDHVVLEVTDDGIGIPEAHFDKVLQPFWTTKGPLATGMGLASSYGIVSRHGGELTLNSKEGEGTTCVVRLPSADKNYDGIEANRPASAEFKCRILVVEDLESLLRILTAGLVRRGQTVFAASSGNEALEILEKHDVDVVICDLEMPDMNGWQVCAAMKAVCEHKGQNPPALIILTGWGSQIDEQEKIAESGVDRVLEKPIDIPTLLDTVRDVLQEHRGRGPTGISPVI